MPLATCSNCKTLTTNSGLATYGSVVSMTAAWVVANKNHAPHGAIDRALGDDLATSDGLAAQWITCDPGQSAAVPQNNWS